MNIDLIKARIVSFDQKTHHAWDVRKSFNKRIKDMPLYFLVVNQHEKDNKVQSVTVTHYVPCRSEMMALAEIIKSYGSNLQICDIGCGNGFLGSLLAREGLNVFGIDDHLHNQPQIPIFMDKDYYSFKKKKLQDPDVTFDVGFCSWMNSKLNLTPQIVEKNPKMIIHIFSSNRQNNGTPTTGVPDAYYPPGNYQFLIGWETILPSDFFKPIRDRTQLRLIENQQGINLVFVYVRKDLKPIQSITPLDFKGHYDWDIERNFINKLRKKDDLKKWIMTVIPQRPYREVKKILNNSFRGYPWVVQNQLIQQFSKHHY